MRHGSVVWCVLAALAVGSCGDDETPRSELPLDLPVVGTVGEPPPEGERITILLTREGYIRVPEHDKPLSLLELRDWLREQTAPARAVPDGSSLFTAYLLIDRRTPWLGVEWLLQTCAHPDVRIWKLSLAATTSDGESGAIGVTLPGDHGPRPTPLEFPPVYRVKVFQRDDGTASGFRTLADAFAALPKDATGTGAVLDVVARPPSGGRVPYETILRIVGLGLHAGAQFVLFEAPDVYLGGDAATDAEAFAARMMNLQAKGGAPRFKLGDAGSFLPPDAEGAAPPPGLGRIHERYGTSLDDWPALEELEEVEEVEEGDG